MNTIMQFPASNGTILMHAGDILTLVLTVSNENGKGSAFVRTNIGRADVMRQEIIENTENGKPFLAADWHDIPMLRNGNGSFTVDIPLADAGFFQAKAFYLPEGVTTPLWPDGGNLAIKVAPAFSVAGASVYTLFTRQAREESYAQHEIGRNGDIDELRASGFTVIPPSGTFRGVIRRLDHIIGELGFRIIQLLPIHPVPTTYAQMGRYGSPFASRDFYDVDPAYAEFDERTTPLEQFCELSDAIHARGARLFLDLPANHTGWASTFQTKHPEWFKRKQNGDFQSPGAWGVTWADLVELDYSKPGLREAMADVFLFWCSKGVDGFRCDAGYMIPSDTWRYIVACVRRVYPETIFMLEGLGGRLETTDDLLTNANLDWAYSELFQEYDRDAISRYLPSAIERGEKYGPLIHFAETHDNARLAQKGSCYARMRTALSAMLSQCGAFGITAGVEWYCRDKIDVHGAPPLSWGNAPNMNEFLAHLNDILDSHPSFSAGATVRLIQCGGGNSLAAIRRKEGAPNILVLVNLDAEKQNEVEWPSLDFPAKKAYDLISGKEITINTSGNYNGIVLDKGAVFALSEEPSTLTSYHKNPILKTPDAVFKQRLKRMALLVSSYLKKSPEPQALFTQTPEEYATKDGVRRYTKWLWPRDQKRTVMVPPKTLLLVKSPTPFGISILDENSRPISAERSVIAPNGEYFTFVRLPKTKIRRNLSVFFVSFENLKTTKTTSPLLLLPPIEYAIFRNFVTEDIIRTQSHNAVLANIRGAMAQVQSGWGEIRSQYDSLLSVNPNPLVPDNRRVFLTRMRIWIRNCGYSHSLDFSCTKSFAVTPDGHGATWRFLTPVGMGRDANITVTYRLSETENACRIFITREAPSTIDELSSEIPLEIIIRPDIENRDFHSKTLAYTGPEHTMPASIKPYENGFDFISSDLMPMEMRATNGLFNNDPSWTYSVPHPIDAERGLGPSGDLFSPGWFSITLRGGDTISVATGERGTLSSIPTMRAPATCDLVPLSTYVASHPEKLFIARRDNLKTVIAGYPWFLDWGRDTLIFLRGLIASGNHEDATQILQEFGRFEENGTLPNIIHGETVGNRDTSDAPLWYAVAAGDLMDALGTEHVASLPCGTRTVKDVIISIAQGYIKGTPNGIKVDKESGLVWSPPHFTWMDTNYPAGTPRNGYPIEIQALWIATLTLIRTRLGSTKFATIEEKARQSLVTLYPLKDGYLADNLRADAKTPAAKALQDDALRPNQLLAVTLGAIEPMSDLAKSIVAATEELLVPAGIRSLADRPVALPLPITWQSRKLNDPLHPFWGKYTGDEDTRRKPAYHNGTAWGWQFPLWCEASLIASGILAAPSAASILGSVAEALESGTICSLPEIMDGETPHTERGCLAQAWSVSEFIRVYKKLTHNIH